VIGIRKIRILIVEDETDVLSLNVWHLEEQGYEVIAAKTLTAARAAIWEHPPDLVLLDVLMPDGSGYDFCAEIRKTTTAPIIYLTCMTGDDDVVHGLLKGGDDYITKPYNLDVLSARIMAQLRRAGLGSVRRIELPPLFIDLAIGKVTLFEEEIALSPKELQLLAFLADRAGRAFTARELYARVWGDDSTASAHKVQVHLSNLRAKLHLDDNSPFELIYTPDKRYMFQKVSFAAEG
jgi:DNA-binding response OmpR family regulator